MGPEVPTLITRLVLLATSTILRFPRGFPKSHVINIARPHYNSNQKIPRVLGALCQEREENQVYISYYKSPYHKVKTELKEALYNLTSVEPFLSQ